MPPFFDMGRTRKFEPLEVLAAAPINSKREVLLVEPGEDDGLTEAIAAAVEGLDGVDDIRVRVQALAEYVATRMGGAHDPETHNEFGSFEYGITRLKVSHGSNVVPIGAVTNGVFYHRALLFKVLADAVGLPCSLVRGSYTRAWNVIVAEGYECVVDLMYRVGTLHVVGKPAAGYYCSIN